MKASSLWIEATSQLAGQTFERAAHLVARSFVERCSRSDGAAGFTPSGLLPAEHELSDNRHRSIADRAHIMTLAARDSVIAPLDIAGDLASSIRRAFQIAGSLKLPVFSAITSRMPETCSRMGLDEPIVGRDMAIAATCHWSTDLTALIAEFLVRYRSHKLHDLIHIMIELPSQ